MTHTGAATSLTSPQQRNETQRVPPPSASPTHARTHRSDEAVDGPLRQRLQRRARRPPRAKVPTTSWGRGGGGWGFGVAHMLHRLAARRRHGRGVRHALDTPICTRSCKGACSPPPPVRRCKEARELLLVGRRATTAARAMQPSWPGVTVAKQPPRRSTHTHTPRAHTGTHARQAALTLTRSHAHAHAHTRHARRRAHSQFRMQASRRFERLNV